MYATPLDSHRLRDVIPEVLIVNLFKYAVIGVIAHLAGVNLALISATFGTLLALDAAITLLVVYGREKGLSSRDASLIDIALKVINITYFCFKVTAAGLLSRPVAIALGVFLGITALSPQKNYNFLR